MSLGGGSSTTTVKIPKPTAQELEIQQLTLEQLQRQAENDKSLQPLIEQYIKDITAENEARSAAGLTPEAAAQDAVAARERAQRMGEMEERLAQINLETIERGGAATPEQIEQINAATSAAQSAGEADIDRWWLDTQRRINEEIAGAAGMTGRDSPMVRLSERAGEESARQQGILTSNLQGANASARLNYPLASASLTSGIATAQQNILSAASNFTAQLNQQAEANRMRLFTSGSSPSISSAGVGATMAAERMRQTTTSTSGSQWGVSGREAGGFLSGLGGLISSDRRLKRDIYQLGELPSGIPVYAFRYKGYETWHVGVMADEVMPVIPEAVHEDESGFYMVDYSALH